MTTETHRPKFDIGQKVRVVKILNADDPGISQSQIEWSIGQEGTIEPHSWGQLGEPGDPLEVEMGIDHNEFVYMVNIGELSPRDSDPTDPMGQTSLLIKKVAGIPETAYPFVESELEAV